jgi:hypothetical protein
MFVLVETADVDVLGVHVFTDRDKADACFTRFAEDNGAHEWPLDELSNECEGTLRLAGDDSYAVQLLETVVDFTAL